MAVMPSNILEESLGSLRVLNPVLNKLVAATVVILVGFAVGKLLGKLVKRMLHELRVDKTFQEATKWNFSVENFLAGFASYFTYFVAAIMGLDKLGVTSTVLNVVAGVVMLIILVSLLLAIKDFIPNVVAGWIINAKKEIKKGVKVKVRGVEGFIQEVNLLETKIVTRKGDLILIPNSVFLKQETVLKKQRLVKKK